MAPGDDAGRPAASYTDDVLDSSRERNLDGRRRAEADTRSVELDLAETGERLRLAVEATGIGIFDFVPATGALRWDARVREIFGVGPDEPVGERVASQSSASGSEATEWLQDCQERIGQLFVRFDPTAILHGTDDGHDELRMLSQPAPTSECRHVSLDPRTNLGRGCRVGEQFPTPLRSDAL